MNGVKLVVGEWYITRNGGSTYKVAAYKAERSQPWESADGTRWSKSGFYYPNGNESGMDLVRRVMPPVDYVPVKKWLWETGFPVESECKAVPLLMLRTKNPQVSAPVIFGVGSWKQVEGSEVEE